MIVTFGEVKDKIREELESIKNANNNYKFTIITPSDLALKLRNKGQRVRTFSKMKYSRNIRNRRAGKGRKVKK